MNQKIAEILNNVKLWKGIAIVAGVFSLIICILIIANFAQINRIDPVNTKLINALVERLNQNPDDEQLRNEIRELDLLVRKAYFTNQWQIRMGGYLMLIGLAILIISIQLINRASKELPVVSSDLDEKLIKTQQLARKWISISGAAIVLITLALAYLTQHKLQKTFTEAAVASSKIDQVDQNISQQKLVSQDSLKPVVSDTAKSEVSANQQKVTSNNEATTKIDTKNLYIPSEKDLKKNFPNFRGYLGNGISYQKNPPTSWDGPSGKNILWKVPIALPGYNSPVIWGGKVFIAGANATKRELYCYELNTGKLLWTANADNIQGTPATSPKVQGDTGHSAPTVTTDGKTVYAVYANGDIIAVDFKGNRVWARNLGMPQNHYGYSSSLIMHKGMVLVQYDQNKGGKLMALSGQTGETVWTTPRQAKVSWSSPILAKVDGRVELLLVADPSITSYDPETGKELWKLDCMSGEVGPSLAYSNGIVFGLNEYASLVAIKIGSTPEKIWEDTEYLSDVPSPVAIENLLFVVTSYGTVLCYDIQSGSKHWTQEFSNGFYSSPIIADNKLYLIDKEGVTHIIKADKVFEKKGENNLGEKTVTTPAFADGKIVIRGEKSLFCIGNK